MKNKGFTLIELLVVITLITIISIAAGVGINEMFQRQREKNYEQFVKTITDAACTYAEINNIEEDEEVTVKDLLDEGLLSKKLENPLTKESVSTMSASVAITMVDSERKCTLK